MKQARREHGCGLRSFGGAIMRGLGVCSLMLYGEEDGWDGWMENVKGWHVVEMGMSEPLF
jgi:hypothetical protein